MSEHYLRYLAPGFDRTEVLEELMGTYGDDVWRFAYFMTGRRDAADDIAQETFIAAYDRLYSFRGEASVKSWLLGITRNKSLHYLRSSFFRRVVSMDIHAMNEKIEGSTASAEEIAFERMKSGKVWEAALGLKRKHREVLLMAYHYDMTMGEIASVLGVAEGTVKSRLSRAKQRMFKLLEDFRVGEGEGLE